MGTREQSFLRPTTAAARGPFSVWDGFLDIVWPPLLGSTGLPVLRALALALDEGGERFEIHDLASLVGLAPSRFLSALDRLVAHDLVSFADDRLLVPERVPGPPVELVSELPAMSRRAAWTWLTQLPSSHRNR